MPSSITQRPADLSKMHNYNLRNQGWPNSFLCASGEGSTSASMEDPVAFTKTVLGVYPSNADIIWAAKTSAADAVEAVGAYNPFELRKLNFGSTLAPRGHFILKAFDRNRTEASGIEGIYDEDRDKEEFRPIAVSFFAGRVFYLMPNGMLLYSQNIGATDFFRAQKCYQEADPTAEDINDLVATDGGVVNINEVGEAYRMVPVNSNLFIFADNGVWQVSGADDAGFSAVNNQVKLVTHIGVRGADSIVKAENAIFYWGRGGIYVIEADEVTGEFQAQNITDTNIQKFYNKIENKTRRWSKGFYDERSRKILWFYNELEDFDGVLDRYKFNKVLILDLILQAFYTYSIKVDSDTPYIAAPIHKEFINTGIIDGSDVVDADPLQVKLLVFKEETPGAEGISKYSFAEFKGRTFKDWSDILEEGKDYESFIETGHDLIGDPIAMKFGNWLYAFFEQTEKERDEEGNLKNPSSCIYRAKWHWSDNENSGKWSQPEQLYKLSRVHLGEEPGPFNYGFSVVETRSKLRGNGKAFSVRFESEPGKDFRMLGWSVPFTGAHM